MPIKKLTMIAIMTSIIIICSQIVIPFAVPFTLQTFAVFCALMILGGRDGLISVALYVLLGIAGLPVFAGFRGGIGHLMGPTGGFIAGFLILCAFYWIFERFARKNRRNTVFILTVGLFLCYLFGSLWFIKVYGASGESTIPGMLMICLVPYILPDLAKLVLALFVGGRVNKALSKRSEG